MGERLCVDTLLAHGIPCPTGVPVGNAMPTRHLKNLRRGLVEVPVCPSPHCWALRGRRVTPPPHSPAPHSPLLPTPTAATAVVHPSPRGPGAVGSELTSCVSLPSL